MDSFQKFRADFLSLARELANDRSAGKDWDPGIAEDKEQLDYYDEEEEIDYLLDCDYEDFPGRKFYRAENLNPDSGEFYQGKAIGVPYAVAVRTKNGQNRLIPIDIPGEDEGY